MQKITDEQFIELIMEKKNDFYCIAFRYMKNEQDAQDVCQEAVCRAYIKKNSMREVQYFHTWFVRILINTAIDLLRKNKKYVSMEWREQSTYVAEPESNPYDLEGAMNGLSDKDRGILVLKIYEDMTFKEIGQVLKKPESTIKTSYYRAIEQLRRGLEDE